MATATGGKSDAREDPDAECLREVAAGRHAAFRALVQTYSLLCYRIAWRQLQSREDAEEVVQEVFLLTWSEPWRYPAGKSVPFKAWLLRVLLNRCTDRLRARTRAGRLFSQAGGVPEPAAAAPEAAARLLEDEQQGRLRTALAALPQDYRTAVNLYYYEQLPQAEVAAVLGRSRRAVETLLRRARLRLRGLLEESR